jgi:hypothetical protein
LYCVGRKNFSLQTLQLAEFISGCLGDYNLQEEQQIFNASKDDNDKGLFALFALNKNDDENDDEDKPTRNVCSAGAGSRTSARTVWRQRLKKFGKTLLL